MNLSQFLVELLQIAGTTILFVIAGLGILIFAVLGVAVWFGIADAIEERKKKGKK